MVEIRAVALEVRTGIEKLAECLLHGDDMFADSDFSAELLLQIGCGREVIGMRVGFQMPIDRQALLPDIGEHRICCRGGRAT